MKIACFVLNGEKISRKVGIVNVKFIWYITHMFNNVHCENENEQAKEWECIEEAERNAEQNQQIIWKGEIGEGKKPERTYF